MLFNDDYDPDKYQKTLQTTPAPAALWAQLQEIEKHREALRAAFLQLADSEEKRARMLELMTEQERLIVQWHRQFLDAMAGVEALSSSNLASALCNPDESARTS